MEKVDKGRLLKVGLVVALVFVSVTAVAAMLDIGGVNNLGSGSADVVSPGNVDDVDWKLANDNVEMVDKVEISPTLGDNWTENSVIYLSVDGGGTFDNKVLSKTILDDQAAEVDITDYPAENIGLGDLVITISEEA